MTTVLVSGASGFLALTTVKQLLEKGYTVVGSVRSTEKGDKISKLLNNDKFSYEIVEDIAKPGAFDDFVKKHQEATVFLHTASPFHFNVTDVKTQLLEPAINGTTSALKAIKAHGPNIKRVVVTSSFAAIASYTDDLDSKNTITEKTWNQVTWDEALKDPFTGYYGSKTFAEKAAWKFVEEEKPNFVLSTVNPVFVFGPQPFDELVANELNTSSEVINSYLKLKSPTDEWAKYRANGVDVRDIASAHIVAFEKEEAKNQRLLLSVAPFTDQTILDLLHKNFPEQTKNIPVGTPGSDKELIENKATVNNDFTKKLLGFDLISLEKTVVDSVKQIFENQK